MSSFAEASSANRQDLHHVLLEKARSPDKVVLTSATPKLKTEFFEDYPAEGEERELERAYFMDCKKKFACQHAYSITDMDLDASGNISKIRVVIHWYTGTNYDLTLEQFEGLFNLVGINRPNG